MAWVIKALGWIVGIGVAAFIAWQVFIALYIGNLEAAHGAPADFAGLELTWKPNQHLMAPEGTTPKAAPHAASKVLAATPEQVRDALVALVQEQPAARILRKSEDGMAFTAVQQTKLMRFPDFVSFEIRPADGGSVVLAYSRSVFGIRDFGVNRKRVEAWTQALEARLPGA